MKNNNYEIDKKQLEKVTGGAGFYKPKFPVKPGRNQDPITEINHRMLREYIQQQELNQQQEPVTEVQI